MKTVLIIAALALGLALANSLAHTDQKHLQELKQLNEQQEVVNK